MLYSLFNNLLYTTWKHTTRHPGLNQICSIKCRALRKNGICSRAYDTSTNSLQLFVTREILATKMSSVYSSALNAFLIHQHVQLPLTHAAQLPAVRSSTAHSTSLCSVPCWLGLMPPALLSTGQQPPSPCSSSSHNSGFHIWPCSWLKSPNLVVSYKEAIPYSWSSSLLFMKLCTVIFLLRGGEGTAQS